jgi:hypothetical protein
MTCAAHDLAARHHAEGGKTEKCFDAAILRKWAVISD